MTFREWTIETFTSNAYQYRRELKIITDTVTEYCEIGPLSSGQCEKMHELLRQVPVPAMPKYPGEVPIEDRAWYAGQMKPDYAAMMGEAMAIINALVK